MQLEKLVSAEFKGNFYQIHDTDTYLRLCNELELSGNKNVFPVQRLTINSVTRDFHHAGIEYGHEQNHNLLSKLDCLSVGPFPHVLLEPACDTSKIIAANENKHCTNVEAVVNYLKYIVRMYDGTHVEDVITVNCREFVKLLAGMSVHMSDKEAPTVTTQMEEIIPNKKYYQVYDRTYGHPEDCINYVGLSLGFSKQ